MCGFLVIVILITMITLNRILIIQGGCGGEFLCTTHTLEDVARRPLARSRWSGSRYVSLMAVNSTFQVLGFL